MRMTPSGAIAVNQEPVNGWDISYNPDDGRFYVHARDENHTVHSIVKELRNARQYARTHMPPRAPVPD